MNNKNDIFLKEMMSLDKADFEIESAFPSQDAREIVRRRQPIPKTKPFEWITNLLKLDLSYFKIGFAALSAIAIVWFFSSENTYQPEKLSEIKSDTGNSIHSSTVLASLTQFTVAKSSVNSSTVLTSIITFVARN